MLEIVLTGVFVAPIDVAFVASVGRLDVLVSSSATVCAVGISGTSTAMRGFPIGAPPLPLRKDAISSKLG